MVNDTSPKQTEEPQDTAYSQETNETQLIYYFMPDSQPTFYQIVVPSTCPAKHSPVTFNFEIVGFIVLIISLLGGVIVGANHILLYQSQLTQASTPTPKYYSNPDNSSHAWKFTLDDTQALIVAEGVTLQDSPYGDNSDINYNIYHGPGEVTITLTTGYIELISPQENVTSEYCGHIQQAENNSISFIDISGC